MRARGWLCESDLSLGRIALGTADDAAEEAEPAVLPVTLQLCGHAVVCADCFTGWVQSRVRARASSSTICVSRRLDRCSDRLQMALMALIVHLVQSPVSLPTTGFVH